MKAAGWACALGLDGWRLLTTTDRVEALTIAAVAYNARTARATLDDELALRLLTHQTFVLGGGPDS